jgi:hypothetical protein
LIKLVGTSPTLCPVHFAESNPTYYKQPYDRSYGTDVDRRVRGIAGGDRLKSFVPLSVLVASLPCVKILFSTVVSSDAFFGSVNLTDFYLDSPLAIPN